MDIGKEKERGMEIRAFRGQYGSGAAQIQIRLPSISFGSQRAAEIYATYPNNINDKVVKSVILSATIQIKKPIIHNTADCFADFNLLIEKLGTDFMWYMADKHQNYIYGTDNWNENYSEYGSINKLKFKNPVKIVDLYMDAYVLLDDKEFVDYSNHLGYDGTIHIGNGQTSGELEYRIFNKRQILNFKEIPTDLSNNKIL